MKSMEMLYLYSERLIIHLFQLSFHLGNWLHRENSLKKNSFILPLKEGNVPILFNTLNALMILINVDK